MNTETWIQIIVTALTSGAFVKVVDVLVARQKIKAEAKKVASEAGKVEADAAAVLIGSTVNVVKLKDELFAQFKSELTSTVEAEREKRRALSERVDLLASEKKIWKIKSQPFKARTWFSSSKPIYATTSTNGSKEKISC